MLWSSIERVQFDISPPAAGQVSRCRGLQVGWSTSSQAAAALWKPLKQRHPAPAHQTLTPTCLLLPGNGNVLQFCLSNIGGSLSVYIVQQRGHLRVGGPSPSSFPHFSHFVPFSHFWLSTGFGSRGKYCLWPDVFPEIVLCDSWTMMIMMMMMMTVTIMTCVWLAEDQELAQHLLCLSLLPGFAPGHHHHHPCHYHCRCHHQNHHYLCHHHHCPRPNHHIHVTAHDNFDISAWGILVCTSDWTSDSARTVSHLRMGE